MTGGYIVYGGYRRQRGAGVLGSIRKYMAPIGRTTLKGIKAVAKNKTVQKLAKQAAAKGAEVLTNVAVDTLQGRNVGESFKERSREVALRTLTGTSPTDAPDLPVVNNVKRQRKRAGKSRSVSGKRVKSLKQRKRLPPARDFHTAPLAKKRRKLSRAALNRKDLF